MKAFEAYTSRMACRVAAECFVVGVLVAEERIAAMAAEDDFYCRYYTGHKGKFGHEFMEVSMSAGLGAAGVPRVCRG